MQLIYRQLVVIGLCLSRNNRLTGGKLQRQLLVTAFLTMPLLFMFYS